jgi:hypothetical protein
LSVNLGYTKVVFSNFKVSRRQNELSSKLQTEAALENGPAFSSVHRIGFATNKQTTQFSSAHICKTNCCCLFVLLTPYLALLWVVVGVQTASGCVLRSSDRVRHSPPTESHAMHANVLALHCVPPAAPTVLCTHRYMHTHIQSSFHKNQAIAANVLAIDG